MTPYTKGKFPGFAATYDAVKAFNLPNVLGARVYVHCDLGYYSNFLPTSVTKNHPSALAYPSHVEEFLHTELAFGALTGPMDQLPFQPWVPISALMTRPKKGTDKRRVIVDLSYPEGDAVNSAIDTKAYLGSDISYTLPTISDLLAKLQSEGQGAYIWKADLARAY